MIALETIQVAFAMYSALPMPQPEWNKDNMRYAMCAFPLIGLVCAAGWWVWSAVCLYFDLSYLLHGAGLCLLPVLITGGIHLDGYADTCDALASNAEPAKKQEILKDPRCGAFAVIKLCTYFVAYLTLCIVLEPTPRALGCMSCAFVMERAMSGLSVCRFPLAKTSGLAYTFATAADRKNTGRILYAMQIAAAAGMLALGGGLVLAAGLLVFWRYRRVTDRQFGGLSGDLAGWFLQRAELWMLAALVFCQLTYGGIL